MLRRAALLLTLLAMLWQSVAFARGDLASGAPSDLSHAALHWQGQAHHHHDDGTVTLDESSASVVHVLCDHVCMSVAWALGASHDFLQLGAASPQGATATPAPHPFLDGLLRPPRAAA